MPTEIPELPMPDQEAGLGDSVLEVNRLTVRFDHTVILADLSFTVARGASLAVIGPNGCGKTVLFRALIGAIAYEGTIRWAPGTRSGYVPQKLDIERDLPDNRKRPAARQADDRASAKRKTHFTPWSAWICGKRCWFNRSEACQEGSFSACWSRLP